MLQSLGWSSRFYFDDDEDCLYVYVAAVMNNEGSRPIFKIGTSVCPERRISFFAKHGRILFAKQFDRKTAQWVEKYLHQRFSSKRCTHPSVSQAISGLQEWYELSPEDLGRVQYGIRVQTDPLEIIELW
jgi:hypothetical protein